MNKAGELGDASHAGGIHCCRCTTVSIPCKPRSRIRHDQRCIAACSATASHACPSRSTAVIGTARSRRPVAAISRCASAFATCAALPICMAPRSSGSPKPMGSLASPKPAAGALEGEGARRGAADAVRGRRRARQCLITPTLPAIAERPFNKLRTGLAGPYSFGASRHRSPLRLTNIISLRRACHQRVRGRASLEKKALKTRHRLVRQPIQISHPGSSPRA